MSMTTRTTIIIDPEGKPGRFIAEAAATMQLSC
jgi:hypothetical protein